MEKEIKDRFKKVERRVDKIESVLSRTSLSKSGTIITCIHCDYIWRTNSKAQIVSCPNCGQKTPTTERIRKKLDKEDERIAKEWIKKTEKENAKYPTVFK